MLQTGGGGCANAGRIKIFLTALKFSRSPELFMVWGGPFRGKFDAGMEMSRKIAGSDFGEAAPQELQLLGKNSAAAMSSGWSQVGMVITILAKSEKWHEWQGTRQRHKADTVCRGLMARSRGFGTKRKNTMKLHVENIPALANKEALAKWFERAGLRVESIELIRDKASCGGAMVKIEGEKFPSKALRHLNVCAFWGRYLEIRKADREMKGDWHHRSDPWANGLAA